MRKKIYIFPDTMYGRLRTIKIHPFRVDNRLVWECICSCGNTEIRLVFGKHLNSGHTKSCGCIAAEKAANMSTHGHKKGGKVSPEYTAWQGLRDRCYNTNCIGYHNYGGRGIIVCDRWRDSFENFFEDMGLRPSIKHSIERRDNEKEYSKENCYWATKREQSRNTRQNVWFEFNGERMVMEDWAIKLGVQSGVLRGAIKRSSFESAYNYFTQGKRRYLSRDAVMEIFNTTDMIKELCEKHKIGNAEIWAIRTGRTYKKYTQHDYKFTGR